MTTTRSDQRAKFDTTRQLDVDWERDSVRNLMSKIAGIRLDDRGTFAQRHVRWHTGMGDTQNWVDGRMANSGRSEHQVVLITSMELMPKETITIDRMLFASTGSGLIYGEVEECSRGHRPGDPEEIWVARVKVMR